MKLIQNIAQLLTLFCKPASTAYTTIIYPSQGKAVVVHDGLGIRHERPWYQVPWLDEDTSETFDSLLHAHTNWADSFDPVQPIQTEKISSIFSSPFEPMETCGVNPANGMPMLDGCFDVMGNAFGTDMLSDSLSFDHGISSFESSFLSFGFD
ncbi:hypothetical protein ACYCFK_14710 [Stutzerimonas stutzeri]